jgi:hypothetical protein
MAGFLPKTDPGLLAWSTNFATKISAGATAYGLTTANATTYSTAQTDFATKLTAATEPSTRGKATVQAKDISRATLVALSQQFARQVQGTMTVTDEQRLALGLTVRKTEPTPQPPPADAPLVQVTKVAGRTINIKLIDTTNPTRRGKPAGVAGASIFTHIGATPPAEITDWVFQGNTGRTTGSIDFPPTTAPGATVWVTAFWFNNRKASGPAADPISANLPGNGVTLAEAA